LNPSTADEKEDDPTIRRCVNFAKRLGYGGAHMLNLFAYRATDPQEMKKAVDPVGPYNDRITKLYIADRHNDFVAAWGIHGSYMGRDKVVAAMIPELLCFGVTKEGHPRHPLYLRNDTGLIPWRKP
jgi:hypothetical protein